MSIEIKLFQVLHGDCIYIKCLNDKLEPKANIIIDAGFARTYKKTLRNVAQEIIRSKSLIDLFIITHTDDDHISGMLPFINEFDVRLVGQFWFNWSPILPLHHNDTEISIQKGITIRDFLQEKKKLINSPLISGQVFNFNEMTLTLLSPDELQYSSFLDKWEKQEKYKKREKLDISSHESTDHEEGIYKLTQNLFKEDQSLSNRSSIAFLLTDNTFNGLFLADSAPSLIVNSLKSLGFSNKNRLKLDFFKVSHHASKANTSDELLSMVECCHFAISSNSQNSYSFPHKESLARIIISQKGQPIQFYFNYKDSVLKSIFTEEEKTNFNITCHYPVEGQNYILYKWKS